MRDWKRANLNQTLASIAPSTLINFSEQLISKKRDYKKLL